MFKRLKEGLNLKQIHKIQYNISKTTELDVLYQYLHNIKKLLKKRILQQVSQ